MILKILKSLSLHVLFSKVDNFFVDNDDDDDENESAYIPSSFHGPMGLEAGSHGDAEDVFSVDDAAPHIMRDPLNLPIPHGVPLQKNVRTDADLFYQYYLAKKRAEGEGEGDVERAVVDEEYEGEEEGEEEEEEDGMGEVVEGRQTDHRLYEHTCGTKGTKVFNDDVFEFV